MLESRDDGRVQGGSVHENLDAQVVYAEGDQGGSLKQYVDEIVRFEKKDYGTMFVFQDANWNVTSTVNYDAAVLDRLHTNPYGQPTFDAYTLNGDYDGDVDTADQTRFDELYPGSGTTITRQPARQTNAFPFAHQGLMLDAETMTYQNRHRQYNPWQERFVQRDPLAVSADVTRSPSVPSGRLSLFSYVGSNPAAFVDPLGLKQLCGRTTCECSPSSWTHPKTYGDSAL